MNARRGDSRKEERRSCSLYLQLANLHTGEIMGDIADISRGGFRLESLKSIPPNLIYGFQMALPSDVFDKPFIRFNARSRWCRTDPLDSRLYDIGFEIIAIDPVDRRTFERVFEQYGSKSASWNMQTDNWRKH